MLNYIEILPNVHTAGSPTIEDLRDMRARGVETVINLALSVYPGSIPDEAGVVTGLGMQYVHIPVEWSAPTQANLHDFFSAFERARQRPVFVHCVKNMRVSAFIYLFRVLRLGEDASEVYYDMAQIWEPEGIWADFIAAALKR